MFLHLLLISDEFLFVCLTLPYIIEAFFSPFVPFCLVHALHTQKWFYIELKYLDQKDSLEMGSSYNFVLPDVRPIGEAYL